MNRIPSLTTLLDRRRALGSFGALGAAALGACGGGSSDTAATSAATTSATTTATSATTATTTTTAVATPTSCVLIPRETEGPFPLFGTIVGNSAYYRSDVTEGKPGVPLRLTLKVVNVSASCAPLPNLDVYIWHTDKDGAYSGYANQNGASTVGQTFCRGIQTTNASGEASFTTIYPGWYAGRITHVHFRVYLNTTTSVTSQLAFPSDVTTAVYASALYTRGQNTSVTSLSADNIFSDGATYQLATSSGSVAGGYDASLVVGIAV
jgi:protocatechuate 3,4-dioxygenase beta subunit